MRDLRLIWAGVACISCACAGPAVVSPGSGGTSSSLDTQGSPLDVCVFLGNYGISSAGYVIGARERFLGNAIGAENFFHSATEISLIDDSEDCDLVIRLSQPRTFSVAADVFSPKTKELLINVKAGGPLAGGKIYKAVCAAFKSDSALGRRMLAEHRERLARHESPLGKLAALKRSPQIVASALETSDVDTPDYSLPENANQFALVIGVENYSGLIPAQYASRDAQAVAAHLKALGVADRNLMRLSDGTAVRSSIEKYVESWLPRVTNSESRVFVYFSGHGAPDVKTGQAYLVPWEGDPNYLDKTGYPVKRLYENLGRLPARDVIVVLDACFSGAGGRSVVARGTRPLVTTVESPMPQSANIVSMSAAAAQEIAGAMDDQGHGVFTYYFLKGLNGDAMTPARSVTVRSLFDYLTPKVADESRRQNRDQTPQLAGRPDLRLR